MCFLLITDPIWNLLFFLSLAIGLRFVNLIVGRDWRGNLVFSIINTYNVNLLMLFFVIRTPVFDLLMDVEYGRDVMLLTRVHLLWYFVWVLSWRAYFIEFLGRLRLNWPLQVLLAVLIDKDTLFSLYWTSLAFEAVDGVAALGRSIDTVLLHEGLKVGTRLIRLLLAIILLLLFKEQWLGSLEQIVFRRDNSFFSGLEAIFMIFNLAL